MPITINVWLGLSCVYIIVSAQLTVIISDEDKCRTRLSLYGIPSNWSFRDNEFYNKYFIKLQHIIVNNVNVHKCRLAVCRYMSACVHCLHIRTTRLCIDIKWLFNAGSFLHPFPKPYVSLEQCQKHWLCTGIQQLAQCWHHRLILKKNWCGCNYTKQLKAMLTVSNHWTTLHMHNSVSFTWKGWSRHNKCWKAIGMFISNLLRKPFDWDIVFFTINCLKFYSCCFTFSKFIDILSPTEKQLFREKCLMKVISSNVYSTYMFVLTIIITNLNCHSIWFNTTDSIHCTSLQSTDKGLARFSNFVIDDQQRKAIIGNRPKSLNICKLQCAST